MMPKIKGAISVLAGVWIVVLVRYFLNPGIQTVAFHNVVFWLGVACYAVAGWQLADAPDIWRRPMKQWIRHPGIWWMALGGYLMLG